MASIKNTRLPKCVVFGELVGGGRLRGESGKRVDEVFPGRPRSFPHQRQSVDDRSPGRWGMAHDCGTKSGTFHAERDRCILPCFLFWMESILYVLLPHGVFYFVTTGRVLTSGFVIFQSINENQIASPPWFSW